ncbi:MAG TPA: hypothetical protein VFC65_20485 [Prolixibacteraceae bacterium]|nr:hypothetical protein [Prolixibacteraceae bacterium]
MEAIYKLKANEINPNLMETIKKLFGSKEITITITTETDETEYLTSNPTNKKHLLESIAQEPSVKFTPGEFRETVDKM